jgi:aldehyde dehydrogenase (NAD(P)+)
MTSTARNSAVTSASLEMSASVTSARPSARPVVDEAIAIVKGHAREFARLGPRAKADLLRACLHGLLAEAPAWVMAGARARTSEPVEEWLVGPIATIRMFRLLAESLDAVAANGKPPLGRGVRRRPDGRLEVSLVPASAIDAVVYMGFSAHALMSAGVDEAGARDRQAAFYSRSDPEGGVSVILGAGNVSSIPPMDVATKMFIEGFVCVLKMSPVNGWAGPFLERALEPLVSRGYLRIVYGGADVGSHLAHHPLVNQIHITGSDRTHDLIVFGPPGPERERRLREHDPLLRVPISSELGNVSPVAVVPYRYTDKELWFMSRNVVTMVVNNGSFNCNAAKMLVTAKGWPQRDRFLELIAKGLAEAPTRTAYYPGAFDRYRTLTAGRQLETFGQQTGEKLPWTLIRGLDASNDDALFRTEPFCGILSEASVGTTDPAEFLSAATRFMNEELWGTLNAMLFVHPKLERDAAAAAALDRAIVELRYGTVGINHWPALGYVWGTAPWGGHPSATLENVQSGLGWVHNTFMLGGIDKAVIRGPLTVWPYPAWFFDNPKGAAVAPLLAQMEASPSWLKLPRLLMRALV